MSGAESIVYKDIGKGTELFAEGGDVLGFLCAVTGVLEKNYVAVVHSGNSSLCVFANNVVVSGKNNIFAEKLGKALCHGSKRKLRLGLTLRLAEVGTKDNLCAVVNKLFNGGESGYDTVFVGDNAGFKRNVKVATNENSFAADLKVIYSFLVDSCHDFYLPFYVRYF